MTDRMTVAKAAQRIYGETTQANTKAIIRLIALGADGPFPGAAKIDPDVANSPYLIPVVEIDAYAKELKSAK